MKDKPRRGERRDSAFPAEGDESLPDAETSCSAHPKNPGHPSETVIHHYEENQTILAQWLGAGCRRVPRSGRWWPG